MLNSVYVKANITYYTQFIGRDDIPSAGLCPLVAHHLWNGLGIPEDQRTSILRVPSPPILEYGGVNNREINTTIKGDATSTIVSAVNDETLHVTIMCIVRTNNYKARMIANYAELREALTNLTVEYPVKLQQSGVNQSISITLTEHLPNMTLPQALEVFASADIILGPHGAGTRIAPAPLKPSCPLTPRLSHVAARLCKPFRWQAGDSCDRGLLHDTPAPSPYVDPL
jgi:hypothetical protein